MSPSQFSRRSVRFSLLSSLTAAPLAFAQLAFAQPPDVPSTIKKPPSYAGGMPAPPPDPPQISPAELQKLTGGPTLVTLSGVDLPTKDVTQAIFEAAKVPESLYFTPQKTTLSVDWKQTPFWVAAAEVERQLGAAWTSNYGTSLSLGEFYSGNGSSLDGKWAAQSPYVSLIANTVSRNSTDTVRFGERLPAPTNRIKSERVQLSLAAYFDPKLQVQTAALRRASFQERGAAEGTAGAEDNFYRPPRGSISELYLPFPNGVKSGTTFSRISGVLHAVLVSANETISVADLVATPKLEKTMTIGNTQYALQSATLTGDQLTIRVTSNTEANANQILADQIWMPFNDVFKNLRVRDGAGQEVRAGSSTRRGGNKAQGDFTFNLRNNRGEPTVGPYSLEWVIATETKSLDVPFELRDVVVP